MPEINVPTVMDSITVIDNAATAGFRLHHRQLRSIQVTGRAVIGSPSNQ
jgi:flagellar basal body rod protein FlgF